MNTTVTNVRTLSISLHNGNSCAGGVRLFADMTASQDEAFEQGKTYSATDSSSWAVVAGNQDWYGPPSCIKYEFKNSIGTVLHTTTCNNNWYAAGQGPNDYCTSSACGQRWACTDTWSP